MTHDEQNYEKGAVVAELADVQARVHCLETKRERFQKLLRQAGRALHGDDDEIFPDETTWPSAKSMSQLRDDLCAAKTLEFQLRKRLGEWVRLDERG